MNEKFKAVGEKDAVSPRLSIVAYDVFQNSHPSPNEYISYLWSAGFNLGYFQSNSQSDIVNILRRINQLNPDIELILSNPDLWNPATQDEFINMVSSISDKSIWGYALPSTPKFSYLSSIKEIKQQLLQKIGNKRFFLLLSTDESRENLGVNLDYATYLKYIVSELRLNPLTFEIYPYRQNGCGVSMQGDHYYRTLLDFAQQSSSSGIPFWGFCNVEAMTSATESYPIPTEEMLRVLVISSFALGAQGIIYKSLFQSDNTSTKTYTLSPVDREMNQTAILRYVRDINREISDLTNIFYGARLIDYVLTQGDGSILTQDISSSGNQLPISHINCTKGGALVTMLQVNGEKYIVLVNIDSQRYNQIAFVRESGVLTPIQSSNIERIAIKPMSAIMLPPGGYAIYKWNE